MSTTKRVAVKFKISTNNLDKNWLDIKEKLIYELADRKRPQGFEPEMFNNFIYQFLVNEVRRKFVKSDEFEVLISEYNESEGSFVITFALVVIGTLSNYSVLDENLEKFVSDVNAIFNSGDLVSIASYEKRYGMSGPESLTVNNTGKSSDPNKQNRTALVLLFSVVLAIAGIFDDQIFDDHQSQALSPLNDQLEKYVEHQIAEEDEKKVFKVYDEVIDKEILKAEIERDTLQKEFLEGLRQKIKEITREK